MEPIKINPAKRVLILLCQWKNKIDFAVGMYWWKNEEKKRLFLKGKNRLVFKGLNTQLKVILCIFCFELDIHNYTEQFPWRYFSLLHLCNGWSSWSYWKTCSIDLSPSMNGPYTCIYQLSIYLHLPLWFHNSFTPYLEYQPIYTLLTWLYNRWFTLWKVPSTLVMRLQ